MTPLLGIPPTETFGQRTKRCIYRAVYHSTAHSREKMGRARHREWAPWQPPAWTTNYHEAFVTHDAALDIPGIVPSEERKLQNNLHVCCDPVCVKIHLR